MALPYNRCIRGGEPMRTTMIVDDRLVKELMAVTAEATRCR